MPISAEQFRAGMRRMCGTVAIVTVDAEMGPEGLTVSSLTSVSADPPTVLVCVNRTASAHARIAAASHLGISLLSCGQRFIAESFACSTRREQRFRDGVWRPLRDDGPPVLDDAACAWEARVTQRLTVGTHTVLFAELEQCRIRDDVAPLLYGLGNFQMLAA